MAAFDNMLAGLGSSNAVPNILNTVTNHFDQQRASKRHTEQMDLANRKVDLAEREMDTKDGQQRYAEDRAAMETLSTNLENEAIQAGMPTSQYMRQPEVAAKYAPLFAPHLNSVTRRQSGDAYGELLDSTQGLNPQQLEDGSWGIFATRKDGKPGVITQNRTDADDDPVQSMNDVEFLDQFVTPTLFKTRLDDVIGNSEVMLGERGDLVVLDDSGQPDPGRSNVANQTVQQASERSGQPAPELAQGYTNSRAQDTAPPPAAEAPASEAPASEAPTLEAPATEQAPVDHGEQFPGLTDQQLQDGFAHSLEPGEFNQLKALNERVRSGEANPRERAALVELVFGEGEVDPAAEQLASADPADSVVNPPRLPEEQSVETPAAEVPEAPASPPAQSYEGSIASPRNRGRAPHPIPDRQDPPPTADSWREQLTQEQQQTSQQTPQQAEEQFTDRNNLGVSEETTIPEDVNEAAQNPERLAQPGRTGGVTNSQIVNGRAVGNPRYSLAQQMAAEALFYKHHTGSVPANLVQRYQQMAAGPDPEKLLKLRGAELANEKASIELARSQLKFNEEWGEANKDPSVMTDDEKTARRDHRMEQWDNIADAFSEERNRRAKIGGMETNERSPEEMRQHMQEWVVSNGPLLANLGLVGFEDGNVSWEQMTDVGQEYVRNMMRTAILKDGVYDRPSSWWRPAATSASMRDEVDFTALPVPTGAPNSDRMRQANTMLNELRRDDPERFQALAQHYDQKGQYYVTGLHSDIANGTVLPTFDSWIEEYGSE